jgi:hypothetical protein
MSEELAAWLETRLAEAPPELAARIRSTLHVARCTLHDLEAAAERLMHEACSTAMDRSGALTLLAADALTTLYHEYGSRLPAPGSRPSAPGSRLPAPVPPLPAPGSRLP